MYHKSNIEATLKLTNDYLYLITIYEKIEIFLSFDIIVELILIKQENKDMFLQQWNSVE